MSTDQSFSLFPEAEPKVPIFVGSAFPNRIQTTGFVRMSLTALHVLAFECGKQTTSFMNIASLSTGFCKAITQVYASEVGWEMSAFDIEGFLDEIRFIFRKARVVFGVSPENVFMVKLWH